MLKRLYDWTLRWAGHRHAGAGLGAVAFIESSIFPVPPDVLLVPMVLARRERAWRYAAICTVMSVAGGFLGYLIGYALYETVGEAIIEFYHAQAAFDSFVRSYRDWGAWIVFIFGLTIFPYKVITIASGVVVMDPFEFALASLASRGLRFYLEAALLWKFGPPIRAFIEKRLAWIVSILAFLVLLGFALIRLFWNGEM